MRTTVLRVLAVLAALLVVLPSVASTQARYVCRMSGRVLSSCCCDSRSEKVAKKRAPAEVRIQSDCCERVAPAKLSVLGKTASNFEPLAPHAWLAALSPVNAALRTAPERVNVRIATARAPPHKRPSLYIAHCALLL